MSEHLERADLGDGVVQVVLRRPPVNALSPGYLLQVRDCLAALDADTGVRAVLITSGLRVFSAGIDLNEARDFTVAQQTEVVDGLNATFGQMYAIRKPVLVAVNGAAIAGGLFFALAADHVICRRDAKLGLTEVRVGVDFPAALLHIARTELTTPACRRLMLGGGLIDAGTAMGMGIVDEVVDPEAVLPRAIGSARDYASIPAATYARVKSQLRSPALEQIERVLGSGSDPARKGWFSDETRDAMDAVMATRKKP